MLKAFNRLCKEGDFKKVYNQGRPVYSNDLMLKFTRNNLENSRVGFVVSHKITNKAVERNRIKRQLREILRVNIGKTKKGLDIVIIVKKSIINKSFAEKKKSTWYILEKANLIE
jgi:ribonuclease P protein component